MNGWKRFSPEGISVLCAVALALSFVLLSAISLPAQNEEMQERVAELKESMARNKQSLAQYTWKEQLAIIVKGEEKKVQHFLKMGPDGKSQRTSLNTAPQGQGDQGVARGRLRQRIVERKKEEFEDYAEQMKALVQRYIPPDRDAIQDAFSKGNVSFTPPGDEMKIAIRSYVKTNDSMTIVFNRTQKQISSIKVASICTIPMTP
jgi:hypothetical protein